MARKTMQPVAATRTSYRGQWDVEAKIWRRHRRDGRALEYALRFIVTPKQMKELRRMRKSMGLPP